MKKHGKLKWGLGIVAVLVVGYILIENPDLIPTSTTSTPTIAISPTDDSAKIQTYVGDLTQRITIIDTEDGSEYGEDTETDTVYFKLLAGKTGTSSSDFTRLAAPDSTSTFPNTATIDITSDLKTIYAEVEIQSAADYYIDADKVVRENTRAIGDPLWVDLQNDGRDSYAFPVDVTGYLANPNQTPAQTLRVFLIDEGSLVLDSPANVDITNTGKQRCNIKWSLDMDNAGDGEAVTLIRATFNATDTTEWYVNDSGIKFPTGSDPDSAKETFKLNVFDKSLLASTYQYEYIFGGGDLNDARMLISPNNGETNFEIPFELWVNMDSVTNALELTLLVQTVDATGAYTTTTDAVACF